MTSRTLGAGVLRRKQTLGILHVKVLVVGAPGASCQGMRLAGWSTDQHPSFLPVQRAPDFPVDADFIRVAQFKTPRLARSMLDGAGHGRDPVESGLIDLAPYVAVVVLDVLNGAQAPEHCPERQRAMRDSVLFNGKSDLEERLPLVAVQGGKSLPEPSRASK